MSPADPTIADQVVVLRAGIAGALPAEVLDAFERERASLADGGVPAGVLAVGTRMPDGDLLDVYGAPTTLAEARAGRLAVVVTYRGEWCPYCNLTLRAYQEQLQPALDARGIALVALSPQKPDGALTVQEKHDLTYAVLSDPGNQIARQLGILSPPRDPAARAAAMQLGADVAATNGDGTDDVPMPTTVLVDAGGTVRWIDVHPDYTTRSEPEDVLAAVTNLLDTNEGTA